MSIERCNEMHKSFHEMVWIGGLNKLNELEGALRYGQHIDRDDHLLLAQLVFCYKELIYSKTNLQRNKVCNSLKEIEKI